jgi:hypothetical protein
MRRTTVENAKDQKTSSRAPAGEERETKSTPAQHVGVRSKKVKDRRPRTAHAIPDREETNFRCACPKRHSGCWPPP